MMKNVMENDHQRNWSERGEDGNRFVLFLAQILGEYSSYICKTKMEKDFHSMTEVLDEMECISYIEHQHKKAFITPFVGKQIQVCEAFDFAIPEDCAPQYAEKNPTRAREEDLKPRRQ